MQPCADHDRASGEGVLPQEYTLIKMEVLPLPGALDRDESMHRFRASASLYAATADQECVSLKECKSDLGETCSLLLAEDHPLAAVQSNRKVFMAAATLRPETMAGQTNAWVLPEGEYGAYAVNEREAFVVTARAALNMAYQYLTPVI